MLTSLPSCAGAEGGAWVCRISLFWVHVFNCVAQAPTGVLLFRVVTQFFQESRRPRGSCQGKGLWDKDPVRPKLPLRSCQSDRSCLSLLKFRGVKNESGNFHCRLGAQNFGDSIENVYELTLIFVLIIVRMWSWINQGGKSILALSSRLLFVTVPFKHHDCLISEFQFGGKYFSKKSSENTERTSCNAKLWLCKTAEGNTMPNREKRNRENPAFRVHLTKCQLVWITFDVCF